MPDNEFYDAKVKVLSEMIKHHVKEEEKRSEGLFAQAKKAGLDMEALGERMMQRKQELMAEFEDGETCRRRRPAASPATSCSRASRSGEASVPSSRARRPSSREI